VPASFSSSKTLGVVLYVFLPSLPSFENPIITLLIFENFGNAEGMCAPSAALKTTDRSFDGVSLRGPRIKLKLVELHVAARFQNMSRAENEWWCGWCGDVQASRKGDVTIRRGCAKIGVGILDLLFFSLLSK
jgi:hypothetical protein